MLCSMSSADDYQVQNVFRYSRKTYKKNRRHPQDDCEYPCDDNIDIVHNSPSPRSEGRSDACPLDVASCSCEVETDGDIASILHKKCPVISLAQQQLQRLLDGTDRLLCDNTRCCRSVYDFLCVCKDLLTSQDKCMCALLILILVAFISGLILGAASCGSYLGHFNSPIFSCIDNYFVPDRYPSIKDSLRSIT